MRHVPFVALLVASVIHLLPLRGVFGATSLAALYGVDVHDRALLLLLRHRAVLFGLLGAALLYAAFVPRFWTAALAVGLVSATSFMALMGSPRGLHPALVRVFVADAVAVACLLAGAIAHALGASSSAWRHLRIAA